jgi:hypothetical protein
MPPTTDAEPKHDTTRRVVVVLLVILIPTITVIGALVLALLEMN